MQRFKPHPPANPKWPEHVQRIYEAGCRRIDELRSQLDAETGAVIIPFRCYSCDLSKTRLSMMTGDGLPICADCVSLETVAACQ